MTTMMMVMVMPVSGEYCFAKLLIVSKVSSTVVM